MRIPGFLCLLFLCLLAPLAAQEAETGEENPSEEPVPLEHELAIEKPREPLIPDPTGQRKTKLTFDFGVSVGYKDEGVWNEENVRMDFSSPYFKLIGDLSMKNDQKYAPVRAMLPSGNFFGFYFLMNEGGAVLNVGNFSLTAGRFRNYDIIESPYSLFLNSEGISANTIKFRYGGPHFEYQTQWIELNSRNRVSSPAWDEYHWRLENGPQYLPIHTTPPNPRTDYTAHGFPDRGANYKAYALRVNDWRIGFLDAAVYTGRSFDLEYFLNPLPQYFIQYVKGTPGRPWTTDSNENNMFGFFWDIKPKEKPWDAYAQLLIDDFSLGFLKFMYDGFSNNPWKVAWAFGGTLQTSIGKFGFHQGGALKYTFAPIGSPEETGHTGDDARTAYGYVYYPETRYYDTESGGGNLVSILIEDNMIGYKHGENNLAFQLDYQHTIKKFRINASLEVSLTGNSSQANPWHEYTHQSEAGGTHFLDDGNVETKLELRANVSRTFGPWTFWTGVAIGGRFNKLSLTDPQTLFVNTDSASGVADTIWIWTPSHSHEFIFRFSIGGKYTLGVL